MSFRFVLRSPDEEVVVRDVVDGRWAEASGGDVATIGEGLWALPGLADAHAHLASAELKYQPGELAGAVERSRAALAAGVTLILDKGWADDVTIRLIETIPREQRPEIEAAARIIASPAGYFPSFGLELDAETLGEGVRAQAKIGAGWVKLIGDWPRPGIGPQPNFDESQLRLAVTVAGEEGCKVAIHTMARDVPSIAVAAGVQSIEHGLFLQEEDLETLAGHGGMWVPTVLRCEATLAQLGEGSSGGRLLLDGLGRLRDLLPRAVDAGVRVLAGTDLVGSPADVAAEALALRRYGLSNRQLIEAVSTAAFRATNRPASFEIGSPADAVFFPESPLQSPEVLRHPAQVLRLGVPR